MVDFAASIKAAREAGHSDEEIRQYLLSRPESAKAREAGHTDAQILDHFGLAEAAPVSRGEVSFLDDLEKASKATGIGYMPPEGFGATTSGKVLNYLGETAENLGPSAVGYAGQFSDLATLAMDPKRRKQILPALGEAAAAAPMAISKGITRAVSSPRQTALNVAEAFKTDPVGTMASVSGLTGLVGALSKSGALSTISRLTSPAAIPELGARAVGAGYERVAPSMLAPFSERAAGRVVENQLYGDIMTNPQAVSEAMRANVPVTPGAPTATAGQRLAEAGLYEPRLAARESSLASVSTPVGREAMMAHQTRLQAIQDQLGRIDAQIQQQGMALSPQARAQLSETRNELLRQYANEEAAGRQALGATGEMLPATGQLAPGEALSQRLGETRDAFREQRITPLYEDAFRTAGNRRIDTRGVIETAENILGGRLADVPLGVATRTVRDLNELQRGATLRELDRVRKSVNKDIATAQAAGKPMGDLYELHGAIDTAVRDSRAIPDRAKFQYENALNTYRTEFVPRFRQGVVTDILRTTKKNQQGLLPSETVSKFLANEDNAAQFAQTFGNDAVARQAMTSGLQDMARADAIDFTTGAIEPSKIDSFIGKHARQLEIMGIDANQVFGPVRAEAQRLMTGLDELTNSAAKVRGFADAKALTTAALDDKRLMGELTQRLEGPAREAFNKEITDRAIGFIANKTPDAAIKYLRDNNDTIRMALGRDSYMRLTNLAANQKALDEVAKAAPMPAGKMVIKLADTFPQEKLTDLKVVADELARLDKAEKLANVRPAPSAFEAVTKEAEESGISRKALTGFLDRKMTFMEKFYTAFQNFADRKTSAIIADAMIKNPEKLADMIDRASKRAAQKAMPKPPESTRRTLGRAAITGAVSVQNALYPENRNAMAR
jgi:hypothetical protein